MKFKEKKKTKKNTLLTRQQKWQWWVGWLVGWCNGRFRGLNIHLVLGRAAYLSVWYSPRPISVLHWESSAQSAQTLQRLLHRHGGQKTWKFEGGSLKTWIDEVRDQLKGGVHFTYALKKESEWDRQPVWTLSHYVTDVFDLQQRTVDQSLKVVLARIVETFVEFLGLVGKRGLLADRGQDVHSAKQNKKQEVILTTQVWPLRDRLCFKFNLLELVHLLSDVGTAILLKGHIVMKDHSRRHVWKYWSVAYFKNDSMSRARFFEFRLP